ncbi:Replication factor C, subunit RFC4 [Friedmanniomyces endolithicus]|nr:Replication factor C, subunit RFC4 [Friedmanniomyces endolithicus]
MAWLSENRYSVVFGSWVASMSAALGLGLTIAVVIISLAFETTDNAKGEGRWETVKIIDPNDPTHKNLIEKRIHHERYAGEDQWRDMIAAEEERMKERDEAVRAQEQEDKKKGKKESHHEGNGSKKGSQGKQQETKEKKVNAP